MGDAQSTFWQEVGIAFSKALGWIVWVLIGVAARLAFESMVKKLSWREISIIVVLSIFSGYIANRICNIYGYEEWRGVVVPVSTLLGQNIMNYIMQNWKKWLDKMLPPLLRNGNGHKKKGNDQSL